jgi:putative CocE/NonD family hydrolase
MERPHITAFCITLLLSALLAPHLFAQKQYAVRQELGVRAAMRDGVELVADIFRPDIEGETFPVLLQRTPYNRKGGSSEGRQLATHGYIVVIQDTRGRYASAGEFYPFRHESQDGYDTVEWAAQLPQSNGKVGMYGGSYVGATQMLASIAKPPHLAAIFPYITASEYYDGWTYQSGALEQWFTESWTTGLAQDTLQHKVSALADPKEWAYRLPLLQYPILETPPMDDVAPYFDDWVRHETNDAYWKPWKISDHYSELTVKGLHAGGWHDIFLKGTIKNYMGLRDHAATSEARDSQRLLIGPWAHAATSPEGKVGDVVFGKQAVLDMTATIAAWSDWALKGIQNEFADDTPVRIFVMGANTWRDEKEFPLARQELTHYYLHSDEGANSAFGDGMLSTEAPGVEHADVFEYDPMSPVPTIGGRLCCGNALPPGPFDQSPNDSRQDTLIFSTPPLEKEIEVTGFIHLELFAATTAVDTDFTALLADVDPSGYARFLTDGIVRARYRDSTEKADPITPGRVYRYQIDLWATSNVFKEGHRIRLYVSSSNFPRFNRNLNTGQPIADSSGWVTARQTILHDSEHPSALILPVIPE